MIPIRSFKMNNLPIRYKLIIFFLLISILPSIGLGILVDLTTNRIVENQVNSNTLQLIGKVNKSLEFYMNDMQNITYFISFNKQINQFLNGQGMYQNGKTSDYYDLRKYLEQFSTLYPEVAGILVVNSQGKYISNELYTDLGVDLTRESWYQEAVKKDGIFKIIGHPQDQNVKTRVNYKRSDLITVVRSIIDPDTQKVLGVVMIDLDLRVIAETVQDVRLGKSGYLTVIDEHGDNIYSPPRPLIDHIPLSWFGSSESGNFSKVISGQKLQFIYQKSPYTNWLTIGVFPTKESVFAVQRIRFYLVCFVYIVVLLGITASLLLSYSLSRPIYKLMSFMRNAESGDLGIRYWGNRMDEVGLLGQRFNNMLVQIKKLMKLTEEQSRQKREAELRSLSAHIKPHFLYNTLDTIHWMARKQNAADVAEMVEALSKLFRLGLSKGQDIIPLASEIEHIESYLKIQKTRYRDKLNYAIELTPGVGQASVLKLVLQPVVENAIYHGIKERRGPGHIHISASRENGRLILRVKDDGAGMSEERLAALRNNLERATAEAGSEAAWSGYGILNVQTRLNLHFGSPYGLKIDSAEGEGTTVTIVHPWIGKKHEVQRE